MSVGRGCSVPLSGHLCVPTARPRSGVDTGSRLEKGGAFPADPHLFSPALGRTGFEAQCPPPSVLARPSPPRSGLTAPLALGRNQWQRCLSGHCTQWALPLGLALPLGDGREECSGAAGAAGRAGDGQQRGLHRRRVGGAALCLCRPPGGSPKGSAPAHPLWSPSRLASALVL